MHAYHVVLCFLDGHGQERAQERVSTHITPVTILQYSTPTFYTHKASIPMCRPAMYGGWQNDLCHIVQHGESEPSGMVMEVQAANGKLHPNNTI